MNRWRTRESIAWTLVVWLVLGGLWAMGFRVHPVVWVGVGALLLVAGALSRLATADAAFPVTPRTTPAPLPRDRRLAALHVQLAGTPTGDTWEQRLRPHLAQLVVDRLRDRHGIDAHTHPEDAARVLGPELAALVAGTTPAPRSSAALRALVERIHSL